ncbi:MAG: hypothetical protein IJ222_01380 [Bacteroidales bacterium]|nr:hypothetical protein [Bacteroidales bacterium]
MTAHLIELAEKYRQAGAEIHDAIRDMIVGDGGFVNASNNKQDKPDMNVLVYNSKKGYTETFPIRALKVNAAGAVEIYVGTYGTIYTDRYLRGKGGEEHWMPLKDSNILFFQTILSIANNIDRYLQSA